ncbi:MalY/PatB family protein [Paenarthrobacter sp. DKR-5]|uniref:MalY/PatB family protein n=1 Tax=Paenarthrobacter sp. DKR-5 TaxID=2835535 RepID=UPI002029064C|nr:aminotransferase class I/II-fold pyridoxal phosphate-dependent enzyme [Paenarthrobacter sp. DKR-5]
MGFSEQFDAITIEQLRRAGGLKWTAFPDRIGSFVAEMDFGTAPAVTRALESAVGRGLFGYLPRWLLDTMTAACAGWQRDAYGWDVPAERIRPLADVLAGFTAAVEHFSAPGSKIILPTPAYMPFLKVPATLSREIIELPMLPSAEGWAFDYDGLDRAFAAGGGLLVMCNPHNPIGKVYTADEMVRISAVVEQHGGRVFADEIHAPLVYPGARHVPYASVSPATAGHTVTATSASKAWNLPGLKTAQLILSNDADARHWAEVGTFAEHGASTLGVAANAAAFADGGPWLQEVINYLDGNRGYLAEALSEVPGIGYTAPSGTYLAWLDCRALDLEQPPAEFFAERAGVTLTDGAECGQAGRGFVRLNFGTPRPVLAQTLDRMLEALTAR